MTSSATDASGLRSPSWVAVAEDEDEIAALGNRALEFGTTAWFIFTSGVMLAMLVISGRGPLGIWSTSQYLTGWDAPWWLTAIFAAEAYASFRRLALRYSLGRKYDNSSSHVAALAATRRLRRLRHFPSARLVEGAPVEEIVSRFVALDAMPAVRAHLFALPASRASFAPACHALLSSPLLPSIRHTDSSLRRSSRSISARTAALSRTRGATLSASWSPLRARWSVRPTWTVTSVAPFLPLRNPLSQNGSSSTSRVASWTSNRWADGRHALEGDCPLVTAASEHGIC